MSKNRLFQDLAIGVAALCLGACSTPRGASSSELTLLSWNLLHGADDQGQLNLEAKGDYIRARNASVVFLQEIDVGCQRTQSVDQMDVLAQLTGLAPRFGAFMPYQGGEYGLGLLCALPIASTRSIQLPQGDEPRVALALELDCLGAKLLVIDVHFNWVADDRARFEQAQALLQEIGASGLACIVAGDFNDHPASRTLAAFYAAGFAHLESPGNSWNARAPSKDIDHILWRSGEDLALEPLGGAVLEESSLSDHRPVLGRLRARRQP